MLCCGYLKVEIKETSFHNKITTYLNSEEPTQLNVNTTSLYYALELLNSKSKVIMSVSYTVS